MTHLELILHMRHPAIYLLEAADDITYICDDIEDGVNLPQTVFLNMDAIVYELKNRSLMELKDTADD